MMSAPWISAQLKSRRYRSMTREQEREAFEAFRAGDESARTKIIEANLKFLIAVAAHYTNKGLPLEDLIAEGVLGMNEAVSRFDQTKNFKFISYAVWWIRQRILKALGETGRAIKLPAHRIIVYSKIQRAKDKIEQQLNREADPEEVAAAAGLQLKDVMEAMLYCTSEISLDFDDYEGRTTTPLGHEPSPDQGHWDSTRTRYRQTLMRDLHPRDRHIVERSYGLRDGVPRTLEEIGDDLDLSKERIRQCLNKAKKDIRHKASSMDAREKAAAATRVELSKHRKTLSIGEASPS